MTDYTLTKTRFVEGVWEGIVTTESADAPPPQVAVSHLDRPLRGVVVAEGGGTNGWVLRVPVPPETIGDGTHTFLIHDERNGAALGSFTIVAGEAVGDDIRAEMELLRAELDLLKRAFRRHCLETS
ncbi:hypothetical protein LVO79_17610 [Roseivivax marinus]|jgi:hypothetical protein|uniref:hypothetical protein n=1 Tax=Roseivivax marinus TaxID=1379903 RepID=UPI001F037B83|nr:hypothetical protein [Roseivivax marinus]UMA64793.1 hypothetical protein LVO79_17610 [Roseivivax marinus]